jgi:two-component system response regulator LytT
LIILIAEDERLAREELIYLLSKEPGIRLLPSATNGRELLDFFEQHGPDAVFLDIQMPEMNGIEAAQKLISRKKNLHIVFTTAYEHYAVEAFGLNAVDYLLKPYDPQRLQETLNRIRKRARAVVTDPASDVLPVKENHKMNRLMIYEGNRMAVIDPESILYAVKEEKITKVYTANNQCFHTKMTLNELGNKLGTRLFFRTHRSYLVNLDRILGFEAAWFKGAYHLILNNAERTQIPVSYDLMKELMKILKGEL